MCMGEVLCESTRALIDERGAMGLNLQTIAANWGRGNRNTVYSTFNHLHVACYSIRPSLNFSSLYVYRAVRKAPVGSNHETASCVA